MPPLAQAIQLNSAFSARHPGLKPTALFVGGTSGIGRAIAERLAHHTNGDARVLLLGRNPDAARSTMSSFPSKTDSEFIPCDVSLMRTVRRTTSSLLDRLPRLNFLVLSPGFFSVVAGRKETEEGIDTKLALLYYARWTFTYELMPLLRRAAEAGEPAHVYSILGAGTGVKVDFDNLGMKKRYSALKAALVSPTYTDLAMQKFASENPQVHFTHAFPGLVRTPMMLPKHPLLKPLGPLISLASTPFTVAPQTCAEYHLSALLTSDRPGFTRRGAKADDIGYTPASEEDVRRMWEHTLTETGVQQRVWVSA